MSGSSKCLYPGLFADYLNFTDNIRDFYRFNPYRDDSYIKRSEELASRYFKEQRLELANSLAAYNNDIKKHPRVKESLEKLKKPESTVVITGQQPGLLTGPLFTIYKAVSAIKLAQVLENKLGKDIIPVFWLASEDHDLSEVNSINIRNRWGKINELKLFEKNFKKSSSIGDINLDNQGDKFLQKLDGYIKNYLGLAPDFYEKWMQVYRSALCKSDDLPSWTARILMELFAPYGMLLVDPMQENIKKIMAPVYLEAVELKGDIYKRVAEYGSKLAYTGYAPNLNLQEDHSGLFFHYNETRKALIYHAGKGFKTRDGSHCFEKEELKEWVLKEPGRFSPNVSFRPVVQDSIFPTLAYVAGPGEVSYFAQLKGVYESCGVKMPVVFPRERNILVEPYVNEIMRKYKIDIEEVFFDWTAKEEEIFLSCSNLDLEKIFQEATRRIKFEHQELINKLAREFPGIKKIEDKNWKYILGELEYLRNKSKQYNKQNNINVKRELEFVKMSLCPQGRVQERIFSLGEYLLYYDDKIIQKLYEMSLSVDKINILEID